VDKVLANKALGRDKFFERESHRCCHLGSDESQDQDQHEHETEEDVEEKGDEKANLRQNEAVRYYFCQYWTYSDP